METDKLLAQALAHVQGETNWVKYLDIAGVFTDLLGLGYEDILRGLATRGYLKVKLDFDEGMVLGLCLGESVTVRFRNGAGNEKIVHRDDLCGMEFAFSCSSGV